MAVRYRSCLCMWFSMMASLSAHGIAVAGDKSQDKSDRAGSISWREQAVKYARFMSRVKWTPVADGMPKRDGYFEKGVEYTGVPYSSVKSEGRYIGFDIFLKTFLAAVQNPYSVVYTENLRGKVANAECYYGKVCSSYTSYGLQCGIWYLSWLHGPDDRQGVTLVEPQSGLFAKAGDVIYRPPTTGGSHVELVTGITRGDDGKVTHVRVEESRPPTAKDTNYIVADFDVHIGSRGRRLFRITDLDAWRGGNRADLFLFPNYKEDSATPVINRVLLLDRGDWVPYHKGQVVRFNIMDRDSQGVKSLVIKRGNSVVETIDQPGKGVIDRSFATCGDYTAHCVMNDDSLSQACEFSVCDLAFILPREGVTVGKSWKISISSENMNIIILYFRGGDHNYDQHNVYVTEQERRDGRVVIPGEVVREPGKMEVWLIGENKYGRLKKKQEFVVEAL